MLIYKAWITHVHALSGLIILKKEKIREKTVTEGYKSTLYLCVER